MARPSTGRVSFGRSLMLSRIRQTATVSAGSFAGTASHINSSSGTAHAAARPARQTAHERSGFSTPHWGRKLRHISGWACLVPNFAYSACPEVVLRSAGRLQIEGCRSAAPRLPPLTIMYPDQSSGASITRILVLTQLRVCSPGCGSSPFRSHTPALGYFWYIQVPMGSKRFGISG